MFVTTSSDVRSLGEIDLQTASLDKSYHAVLMTYLQAKQALGQTRVDRGFQVATHTDMLELSETEHECFSECVRCVHTIRSHDASIRNAIFGTQLAM